MKRVLAAIALAAAAAAAVGLVSQTRAASGAVSGGPADIPVLRVGIVGSVSTLDPARAVSNPSNILRSLGYDGLVKVGADGRIRPWLARRIRHPNPNTWFYDLRRG